MVSGKLTTAGDLRESIVIRRVTETRSATGAVIPGLTTVLTTRARVEPLQSMQMERPNMDQIQSMQQYVVTIRKRSVAVVPRYEILWRSRVLDIESVIEIGAEHRFLQMRCMERNVA
jgi:SPP1 family predicted phage head-tail adaptor